MNIVYWALNIFMKSFLNITFNILSKLFFAGVILVVALLLLSRFTLTDKFRVLIVQSGSMEPAIHTGSVVAVLKAGEYYPGDVITFGEISRTKTPTTHRISEVQNDNGAVSYITKGDANENVDFEPVKKEKVFGKVLFSVPYFGYVIDLAKKPWGFALVVGLPALIIIIDEIMNIVDEVRKRRKLKVESKK
ncbi:MAG: Type I signal peptidase [Candidatus Falkowbacteria bacterium GW2011_GWC2_38_22]|uniref:Signal peptidase I n=1 Tax=Candidatus Falkowbacteria bacterium GW2011_GWE1_38_31 TaxID=1618638 RepID=A0A0G0N0M4_9BACT|nr:MAG: Type I signal peptidase [Candidatus Falkowbacteria bacterium GW2011_GWF2_38_1205]KKQ61617.1 MAG: Type I signal peptidase [Candidatus Falkowbacteria bacterium GW2011_GWC2_38_22]KKQ63768.1 MAG: Type I signal peptidase [Candidatus Falkowbacteria bacterium GW2011_GWF1_38_22]KKQ65816.1 MAG: Type I signal peptidase [Candidatus Falkowbacteria bacterium GW2011_GWE2_38_254]KKQ70631.1 MAG: Type I signal peptidase [Candidatus Falkowbacteria bacterium GW2011_GWE1_38_31]KKQ73027.1 MAG: Type I signa